MRTAPARVAKPGRAISFWKLCWILWAGLATSLAMAGLSRAQPSDSAIILDEADWPCPGKYRLAFSAAAVWSGPPLGPETDAWREDAEVRRLAERLASPETMLDQAPQQVAEFAESLADVTARNARLTLLFRGILDELNLYRRVILEGIVGFVARSRLAADALAEFESELEALPDDGRKETEAKRKTLDHRRFWTTRVIEKSDGEARFQCRRLTSLEAKLGLLARAIAENMPTQD